MTLKKIISEKPGFVGSTGLEVEQAFNDNVDEIRLSLDTAQEGIDVINSFVGVPDLQAYPIDFAGTTVEAGSNPYINDVPLLVRGVLSSFRIKAVIGSTVTPRAYSITGSNGAFVFTILHTYASFITSASDHTQSIIDDYIIEAGQFIGFESTSSYSKDGGVNYLPPSVSSAAHTLAYDFVINTNISSNLQTKLNNLNIAVSAPESQSYPLNFDGFEQTGSGDLRFIRNSLITKRGQLNSVRVKAVPGSRITLYVYSVVGSVLTLLHTYPSFVTSTIETNKTITDDYIIEAGLFIGIQGPDLYFSSGNDIRISDGTASYMMAFDFVINTNVNHGLFKRVEILENGLTAYVISQFRNKKIVIEGDSIMEGGYVTANIAARTGCTIINLAKSGSGYVNVANGTIRSRIVNVAAQSPDCVFIAGGTNDWDLGHPIGSAAVLNNDAQFYSAVYNTFRILKEQNKLVPVLVATPIQRYYTPQGEFRGSVNALGLRLLDYVNVIKEVAQIFSIEVVDLYSNSGITLENINETTLDTLHANAVGAQLMGGKIVQSLNGLVVV